MTANYIRLLRWSDLHHILIAYHNIILLFLIWNVTTPPDRCKPIKQCGEIREHVRITYSTTVIATRWHSMY
ncbi:hypothetical protein CHUAL_005320 [Chamberlinius hualienensis]